MENCCESIIKYLIFFLNFLLAVAGLALIGSGAYVHIEANSYLDFLSTSYVNTPIFFIILGVIIFVVSFFGCCGSLFENKCMIYTYSSIIIAIFLLEVGGGTSAYFLQDNLKAEISKHMTASMVNYGKAGYEGVTETWDGTQNTLKCCGVNNSTDWSSSSSSFSSNLPDSCCDQIPCNTDNTYKDGCLQVVDKLLMKNIHFVAAAAIGLAFLQLLLIIFSCCIGHRSARGRGHSKHYLRA